MLTSLGGASGIGLAAATLLATQGARVYILDLVPPTPESLLLEFIQCNVTLWSDLKDAFSRFDHIDMVFANAGITDRGGLLDDAIGDDGSLVEPKYEVLDVNLRAVLNTIKLSYRAMRGQEGGGSIVLTSSATAYAPEGRLPVYSAAKLAVRQAFLGLGWPCDTED